MEIKILQVFYDKNGLPYKDKERTVHYPITSGTFLGASNTTQIRFYYDQLDELNESTFVAVSKLPNGKIGSEILESEYDSELQESYAILNLNQFYTQYKGDVFISLQGYQGGVRVEQDEDGIYQIYGTPTIQATGSIRMYVAYAPTFVGSGQTENITLQRVLAELSTKLGIRQETLHVEELPTVGNPNVWYVINDDPNDTTKANIYIWNATTQTYVWVGDNTLDLGNYYTTEQGEQFENDIDNRVTSVENELSSVASGSPKGVFATVSDLTTANPDHNYIYVVTETGNWYYWNETQWSSGGTYISTDALELDNRYLIDIEDIDYGTMTEGKYVNNSGSLVDNESSKASDYIEIKPNSNIHLSNVTCRGSRAFVVCDNLKNAIQFVENQGDTTEFDITTRPDAAYLRFTALIEQTPHIFYKNVYEEKIDTLESNQDILINSLYKDNDFYECLKVNIVRVGLDRCGLFYDINLKTSNKFKITNSNTNFGFVVFVLNGHTWTKLDQTWLYESEKDYNNSYDRIRVYCRKSDNTNFTDADIENLKSAIKLHINFDSFSDLFNKDFLSSMLPFLEKVNLSQAQTSGVTYNQDGSITIASGGYYFAYYYIKDIVLGNVYISFYDGGSNLDMYCANSPFPGSSNTFYLMSKSKDGHKVLVLDKSVFTASYPYLCVRVNNRDNDTAYTFSDLTVADLGRLKSDANSTLFVSPNGNNDNNGLTSSSPLATVNKALSLGASNILLLSGTYNQQIDLANATKKIISIRNYTENGIVLFRLNENTIATSENAVSGYTKVYSFTYSQSINANNKWLYQENVPDVSTLITDEERNALQRGYEYRCQDTKIIKCSSNILSDALTEIENADTNVYKWYQDGSTIYFSRPQTVNSSHPICISLNKSFITNGNRSISLELAGINTKYMYFGLQHLGCAKIMDCKVSNAWSAGGYVYDTCLSVEFIRCETERTQSGSNGDGFNGHSSNTGDIYSKQTTCTLIDCWSHDNNDDGYSDHERSEITIIGGLYEYNQKGGITPSYGSHCTCYNVISRNNINGFYYTGAAEQAEGGKYGQMTCFNCVAENNNISGFIVDGTGNSMLLVNCKSINNTYGYNPNGSTNKATLIDCGALNNQGVKGGAGTYIIKNTTLVE